MRLQPRCCADADSADADSADADSADAGGYAPRSIRCFANLVDSPYIMASVQLLIAFLVAVFRGFPRYFATVFPVLPARGARRARGGQGIT